MSAKTWHFAATALIPLLAACSTAPAEQSRSPKAAKDLADALAGRVAGPPQRCISNYPHVEVQVIDDWTILFREGSTVYVQNPQGGCPGIGTGSRTLVTRQVGTSQMCQGDINQAVDLRTGIGGAACVFGPFIPYTKPQ
ncbi:MAG TPA: hypothetical protein VFO45_01580 [Sphingomicrobium sp.]|nr:hypothetical protein [Sphingomicrobium sp.]